MKYNIVKTKKDFKNELERMIEKTSIEINDVGRGMSITR